MKYLRQYIHILHIIQNRLFSRFGVIREFQDISHCFDTILLFQCGINIARFNGAAPIPLTYENTANRSSLALIVDGSLERETGLEPATFSLGS